jgi:histone H3
MAASTAAPPIEFPDVPSDRESSAREFKFGLGEQLQVNNTARKVTAEPRSKRKTLPKRRSAVDSVLDNFKVSTKRSSKNLRTPPSGVVKEVTGHEGKGGIKKPHRFRPGTVALREIRKFQRGSENLIRTAPFKRIVRELAQDIIEEEYGRTLDGVRFRADSFEALQQAAESFAVDFLDRVNLAAIHAKRVTIQSKDVFEVLRNDNYYYIRIGSHILDDTYRQIYRMIKEKTLGEGHIQKIFGTLRSTSTSAKLKLK